MAEGSFLGILLLQTDNHKKGSQDLLQRGIQDSQELIGILLQKCKMSDVEKCMRWFNHLHAVHPRSESVV